MNNTRPPLADQIYDLLGNETYDRLIQDFQRELEDIEIMKRRGTITDAEYAARKEAAGQAVELAIYELWRKVTGNE